MPPADHRGMKRYLPWLAILVLLVAFVAQVATAAAAKSSATAPTKAAFDFHHPTPAEEEAEEAEEEELEADEIEVEECEAGDEIEFGAEEEEEEGEEAEEEEFEEGCEEVAQTKKGKKGAPFVTAPVACQVSRAESTITTLPASDQVRLTIRYRTWAPTPVTLSLKLRDGKGAVGIEHTTKHLAGHGVLHLTTKLGDSIMERALDATEFDVSLRAPESPAFCAGALEQELFSAKHTGAKAPRVYSD